MTRRQMLSVAGVIAVVSLLLAAVVQVQATRERAYPTADNTERALYLQSGPALYRLTISLNALASDLYWIRAIQYYGGTKRRLAGASSPAPLPLIAASSEYELLYPLLDITTTLDPRFRIAYRFGSVFLAEPHPSGPGRPDLAVRLLEKGLRQQPDKWEYMQDIGFVHYWYNHDYKAAADWFLRASELPGAPWWLRSLAATTLARGGDRRTSRTMWMAIQESAEVDWLRRDAERRLAQLDALDQIDRLQQILDSDARQSGRPVTDWQRLVQAGVLRGVPVDPAGAPYDITPDGHVRMSPSSSLWPLPVEPARRAQTSSKAVFWPSEASFASAALEAVLAAAQRPPSHEDSHTDRRVFTRRFEASTSGADRVRIKGERNPALWSQAKLRYQPAS